MPLTDNGYEQYTADDIQQRVEQNLEDLLGMDAEAGDLVTAQLEAESETLADVIEESLQRVYEASYLQDATGNDLDKLVDLIGLSRNEATSATGTVRFGRESPPTTTYVIPSGIEVQTGGVNPIVFETTEQTALERIDGFESGGLEGWEGDTDEVGVVPTNVMSGNYALELPATADTRITTTDEFGIGTLFDCDIHPQGETATGFQFGYQDTDNFYEAVVDANGNDLRLREVRDGVEENRQTVNVAIDSDVTYHLEVEWSLYGDHVARLFASSDKRDELAVVFLEQPDSHEWDAGLIGVKSNDATATTLIDEVATSGVTVNIEAVDAGPQTNISAGSIEVIKDGTSGIESVTNSIPTGDTSLVNTNLSSLVTGESRETDVELRERAFENTAIGGAATDTAIGAAVQQVDGVQSVEVFVNKSDEEQDGLPASSFEVVVHGGRDDEIADALHRSSAIDSTDYGGAHGTETTHTITTDILADPETYHWSRPEELALSITIDLITDDTYVGDEAIKSRIINHIGGTDVDGSFIPGTDPGEDVYEAVLKQQIVNPDETGVWEVDSLAIDATGDGTDDTTTLSSGADVLAVQSSEIAETNGRDDSITINTTER